MRLVEGVVRVGGEAFPDVDAFVERLEAERSEASERARAGRRDREGAPPDGRAGGASGANDDTRPASREADRREASNRASGDNGAASREADHRETADRASGDNGAASRKHDTTVQAFDARYVVSRRHLERAVELADRARERGNAIARDRGLEIMLYAAGRRQIDRALEMGVDEGETPAVVLVDGDDDETETAAAEAVAGLLDPAETLGAYDGARVRSFFDVEQAELDATDRGLEGLVLERVALLVVER
jgi:KEOPS complex subunit Cgi121